MITTAVFGFAIWTLAFIGAWAIAGPIGLIVATVAFVTAAVLGVLHQKDLADKYIVIPKDHES